MRYMFANLGWLFLHIFFILWTIAPSILFILKQIFSTFVFCKFLFSIYDFWLLQNLFFSVLLLCLLWSSCIKIQRQSRWKPTCFWFFVVNLVRFAVELGLKMLSMFNLMFIYLYLLNLILYIYLPVSVGVIIINFYYYDGYLVNSDLH